MELRVLGPVQVWVDGQQLDAGPRQQRLVLAALVVDVGRPVVYETLVDRVWGERPPAKARAAIHSYAARIRRLLAEAGAAQDGGPPRLVHRARAGGYLLQLEPDRVDLHRFRRLAAGAHPPGSGTGPQLGQLRAAVQLWRGEPLAGLPGRWAADLREGWRREYLDTVVAWAQSEADAGNPGPVVEPIRTLVGEHPLDERLVAALMRVLYAADQTAAALDCYTAARTRLVGQLGVEPGPELRRLHQAILRGDRVLPSSTGNSAPAPARQPVRGAGAAWVVPAQLPADPSGFTGRADEVARLDALLAGRTDQPTTMVISAVSGMAGVGKTALAVHWSHRVRQRFPDGQLYVNLRGYDPGAEVMAPARALRMFLHALGVSAERVPPDLDAQIGLYRSLLAGKRVLVVLDNARDADQARPLLPGSPGCLAIVTSRNQLAGLVAADGARPLALDLLSAVEARQLLARRLGPGRVAAEPEAVEQIIGACARLPLALTIASARAATSPSLDLATLAAELADASNRLDALTVDDPATQVRAVFSWSYHTLSPPAAGLFRVLGLHPGPDTSAAAAASLADLPLRQVRPLLAELTRASLLTEPAPGRYASHDLLRAYAANLTHTVDTDGERRAAVGRLLDHYVHTASTADRLLNPSRDPTPLPLRPPAANAGPQPVGSARQALDWLSAEHSVLLAAVRLAADAGYDTHAWQLAWYLHTFLYRRGHWPDLAAAWRCALSAADRLGEPAAQACAHYRLAHPDTLLGRYDDAHARLRRALDLYTRAGDRVGQAQTHNVLSHLRALQDRHEQALEHAQQALALHHAAGHVRGEAHALNQVGWCQTKIGHHVRAVVSCGRALTLLQQIGDRWGQAQSWDNLGYAHHHLGHHTEADHCCQRALALYRSVGDRYREAHTLIHLGEARRAAADPDAARAAWQHALDILVDLDHADADTVRGKLRAVAP